MEDIPLKLKSFKGKKIIIIISFEFLGQLYVKYTSLEP